MANFVVGLTGGIASGKTTVADEFAALGVDLVDADIAARVIVEPGQPALAEIADTFGAHVLQDDGSLDRRALRDIVFADPAQRLALEAITHGRIRAQMQQELATSQTAYTLLVVPLLIEGPFRDLCERVLVVDVPEQVQIERLVARDGSSEEQARSILAAQASRQQRLDAADDVLANTGDFAELKQSITALHKKYLNISAR